MKPLGAAALLFGLLLSHGVELGLAYTKGGIRGFGGSSGGSGFGGTSEFPSAYGAHSSIELGPSFGSGGSQTFGSSSGIGSGGGFGGRGGSGLSGAFGGSSGSGFSAGFGGSSGFGGRSFPGSYSSYFYLGSPSPWLYGLAGSSQGGRGLLGSSENVWSSSQSEGPEFGSRGGYGSASSQWGHGRWGGSHAFGSNSRIGSRGRFGGRSGSGLIGAFGGSSGSGFSAGFGGSRGFGERSFPGSYSSYSYLGSPSPWLYGLGGSSQGGRGLLGLSENVWSSIQSEEPEFGSRGGYGSASSQWSHGGWRDSCGFGSNSGIGSRGRFSGRSERGLSGTFGSSSGSGFSGGFGGSSGSSGSTGFGARSSPGSYLSYSYHGTQNPWVYGVGGSTQAGPALLGSQEEFGSSRQSGRRVFGSRGGYGSGSRRRGYGNSGGSVFGGSRSGYGSGLNEFGGQGDFGSSSSGGGLESIFSGSRGFVGQSQGQGGSSLYGSRYGSTGSSASFGSPYGFSHLGQPGLLSGLIGGGDLYSNFGGSGAQGGLDSLGINGRFGQRLLQLLSRLQSRLLRRRYLRYLRRTGHGGIFIFLTPLGYPPLGGHSGSQRGFGESYGGDSWRGGSYGHPSFYYFTFGPQGGVGSLRSRPSQASGFGASSGPFGGSSGGLEGSSGGFRSGLGSGKQEELSQVRY